MAVTCPKCSGSGSVPNGTDEMACRDCRGTGERAPDQIDEFAQALYACFCPFGSFEHAFQATQELYRNGVRVVLERAGAMGGDAAAKEPGQVDEDRYARILFGFTDAGSSEPWDRLSDGKRNYYRNGAHAVLEAVGVERLRENLAHQARRGDEATGDRNEWRRRAVEAEKERDEQKARADRAVEDWKSVNGYDDLLEAYGAAGDRISALEKAIREHVDSYPWQEAPELTALRAALDAPQPNQDSGQPGSAGSSAGNQDVSAPSGSVASPPAQPGCSSPIPDGILIAAAVYECVVLNQKEGGLKTALNASGQYAGLDYGLDLEARMNARKEARSK